VFGNRPAVRKTAVKKAKKTTAKTHRHVENLDYTRTMGDYNSNFLGTRKELSLGAWTRKDDSPKWLRKSITVGVDANGFYTANGSLIRRSIVERYYNPGHSGTVEQD